MPPTTADGLDREGERGRRGPRSQHGDAAGDPRHVPRVSTIVTTAAPAIATATVRRAQVEDEAPHLPKKSPELVDGRPQEVLGLRRCDRTAMPFVVEPPGRGIISPRCRAVAPDDEDTPSSCMNRPSTPWLGRFPR
jgi:hypothetical protein